MSEYTPKYTTGPWDEQMYQNYVTCRDDTFICRVEDGEFTPREANGALISAAPEMLGWCELLLAHSEAMGLTDDQHNALYDVVQKAGGKCP